MQVKKKPKKTAKAVPEKSRKKKQPSEDQIKKQPFLKRMLFGEEKPDLSELEAGSTTILDILSPTTVDTKSRDYIIVDDVYHAYLYMINGLIACDTPHIIKGRIVKVIRTESEEKFSAQGNHIGSEVKETITNKMIFNVLTPNGFKALT